MRTSVLFFISITFIFIPLIGKCQFNRLNIATKNTVDSIVNVHKTTNNWVGMSVGIVVNGEIAFLDGYGVSNKATGVAANMFSVYRLASVSKTLTAVLTLKLAQMGMLDLEDFVQQYVPEYPNTLGKSLVKIRHLLANESGIPNYGGCGPCASPQNTTARTNYINNHGNVYDPVSAIDIFKDQALCFTPGSNYLYTTFGFNLLAAVIERASNSSFQEFLFDHITCPMNMPMLQIEYQDRVPYQYEVTGYQYSGSAGGSTVLSSVSIPDISYKAGGGGLIGSVVDLSLFIQGLVNNNFINDSMITVMGTDNSARQNIYTGTSCSHLGTGSSIYGYGTNLTTDMFSNRIYYHGGNQDKTSTYIRYSPDSKHGVVIMCNTEDIPDRYNLCRDIYYAVFNAPLSTTPAFSPILYTWDVPSSSTHILPGIYESNYIINSTGKIYNGDTTKLKANEKITLSTGFKSFYGSKFQAKVNNCD
tara:strand:+ start:631 stop:2052 length:1422 start_codon:yes stop_codon:yes gene_type:complete